VTDAQLAAMKLYTASGLVGVSAQIADVFAGGLLGNITVDGVTIDRLGYYKALIDIQKAMREAVLAAAGPFEVVSVCR
jgi:hypothetical protein